MEWYNAKLNQPEMRHKRLLPKGAEYSSDPVMVVTKGSRKIMILEHVKIEADYIGEPEIKWLFSNGKELQAEVVLWMPLPVLPEIY